MAKNKDGENNPDPKDPPKEWDASQALEDPDEEEEANIRSKRAARVEYLKKKHMKEMEEPKPPKGGKPKKNVAWD